MNRGGAITGEALQSGAAVSDEMPAPVGGVDDLEDRGSIEDLDSGVHQAWFAPSRGACLTACAACRVGADRLVVLLEHRDHLAR
jgi:hypothetical protein